MRRNGECMEFLEKLLLVAIGLFSGIAVAGGIFAFITMVGVVSRLASRTKTVKYLLLYEEMVVIGGTVGNIVSLYGISIFGGTAVLLIFGLFSGVFTGCLAMALSETLNVFPVFLRRIKLHYGLPWIVLCFALGKAMGAFFQLYVNG